MFHVIEAMVWVLDTSALVEFKKLIPIKQQWDAFKQLEKMVSDGQIMMPRKVIQEAEEIIHPDVPGAWASGVRHLLRYSLDEDYEWIRLVMQRAGDVVDKTKTKEEADPYVLACALQLIQQGALVIVVTNDQIDRLPIRIALTTACNRLGISWIDAKTFLHDVKLL